MLHPGAHEGTGRASSRVGGRTCICAGTQRKHPYSNHNHGHPHGHPHRDNYWASTKYTARACTRFATFNSFAHWVQAGITYVAGVGSWEARRTRIQQKVCSSNASFRNILSKIRKVFYKENIYMCKIYKITFRWCAAFLSNKRAYICCTPFKKNLKRRQNFLRTFDSNKLACYLSWSFLNGVFLIFK